MQELTWEQFEQVLHKKCVIMREKRLLFSAESSGDYGVGSEVNMWVEILSEDEEDFGYFWSNLWDEIFCAFCLNFGYFKFGKVIFF